MANALTLAAGPALGKHAGSIRRINRQINKYVKSTNNPQSKHVDAGSTARVALGQLALVKLSEPRVQKLEFRAFDRCYLNYKVRELFP